MQSISIAQLKPEKFKEMLDHPDRYPLFSSMYKYLKEDKSYREWLESIPFEVLREYMEHPVFEDKNVTIDKDLVSTIVMLHSIGKENDSLTPEEICDKTEKFQNLMVCLFINKSMEVKVGLKIDAFILGIKGWDAFLDVGIKKNPAINFKNSNSKKGQ